MNNLKSLIDHWKNNKLIKEITNVDVFATVIEKKQKVYLGIDPTYDSLHIGHLVTLNLLKKLNNLGCPIIVLIGNYTCRVGDPSFREKKRLVLDNRTIAINSEKIITQVKKILPNAIFVKNESWYKKTNLVNFLTKIGGLFTVNKILEKESLSTSFQKRALLYSDFSYILLQAYDFYCLWKEYDCHLQIGGSDQYPNIVFGVDLIQKLVFAEMQSHKIYKGKQITNLKKLVQPQVCGVTTNLLLNSKGQKISKSSDFGGQIWLDPVKTTFYESYQFFYNLDDSTAIFWIKMFDFTNNIHLPPVNLIKGDRFYQKQLFFEIVEWLFDKQKIIWVEKCLNILSENNFSKENLIKLSGFLPCKTIKFKEMTFLYLISTSLNISKTKTLELIKSKAIEINSKPVIEPHVILERHTLLSGQSLIIKKGKKSLYLIFFQFNS